MTPLELNKIIERIFHFLFLNMYTSPLFWIFLPSLVVDTWIVSLFTCFCYFLGVYTFVVSKIRQKKSIVDWSLEIIVVTGGSNGIGARLCEMLLDKGAKVIVIDRMKPKYSRALFFTCDLSIPAEIIKTTKEIKDQIGHPTMLVNNAGVVSGTLFLDTSYESMERTIRVNLLSHFYLVKEFLPSMILKRRGHILSVSSVLGRTATAFVADYSASKFAVAGYMEALRQEVYGTGVHVSVVYPGLTNSGMFDGVNHLFPYATPRLEVEDVACAMFEILESNKSQEVPLPFYVRFSPLLRCLPVEVNDWIHRWTGANDDLKSYKGKKSSS